MDKMKKMCELIEMELGKIAEKGLEQCDFILTVPTDKAGLLDVAKLDKCYKFGYETVIQNLDKIKEMLK